MLATFTAAASGQIAAVARTPEAPIDSYRLVRLTGTTPDGTMLELSALEGVARPCPGVAG